MKVYVNVRSKMEENIYKARPVNDENNNNSYNSKER